MSRTLLLFLLFYSCVGYSQKITIDPALKVRSSDFKIDWPDNNQNNRPYNASKQYDAIYKDSLVIQVVHVTWTAMGLHLVINKNGKVKPKFIYYDDSDNRTTLHNFDSSELTINTTKYKLGTVIKVKFTGKIKFKGSELTLSENFIHMVQNMPNKEARKLKNASKNKVLNTGFYSLNGAFGEKYGLPKYRDEDGFDYYIDTDSIVTLSSFTNVVPERDTLNKGDVKLKFMVHEDFIKRWEHIKSLKFPYAFILDNKVMFFATSVTMENKCVIIYLQVKSENETQEVVRKINKAIADAWKII